LAIHTCQSDEFSARHAAGLICTQSLAPAPLPHGALLNRICPPLLPHPSHRRHTAMQRDAGRVHTAGPSPAAARCHRTRHGSSSPPARSTDAAHTTQPGAERYRCNAAARSAWKDHICSVRGSSHDTATRQVIAARTQPVDTRARDGRSRHEGEERLVDGKHRCSAVSWLTGHHLGPGSCGELVEAAPIAPVR
jgi:hypothetical protein